MRRHIHNIRQSEPSIRRRWLIGLSGGAIAIVIFAWILYMQAFVFTTVDQTAKEDVRIGLWPIFTHGLSVTGSSVERALDHIVSAMPAFGKRTTTIENPQ